MNKKKIMVIIGVVILFSLVLLNLGGKKTEQGVRAELPSAKEQIAVIYVDGVITSERNATNMFAETGGSDGLIKQLHKAGNDDSIKAIILRINSPGGSVTATQEVGDEIKKIRAKGKLVVTSMGDIAASGGYWLAACTDKIYANSTTLTGSIGVYISYSNWEELYKKIGVKSDKIKSGVHKDILANDRPMTEEERQLIQNIVDENYDEFVNVVAEGRKLDRLRVKELADGRIYSGRQAKELGLVDELGNLYDVVDKTAKEVGIQGKPKIKEYNNGNPFSGLLEGKSKVELIEELFSQHVGESELKSIVPMAIPAKG